MAATLQKTKQNNQTGDGKKCCYQNRKLFLHGTSIPSLILNYKIHRFRYGEPGLINQNHKFILFSLILIILATEVLPKSTNENYSINQNVAIFKYLQSKRTL